MIKGKMLLLAFTLIGCNEHDDNIRKFFPHFQESFRTCTETIIDGEHFLTIDPVLEKYHDDITQAIISGSKAISLPGETVLEIASGHFIFHSPGLSYKYDSGSLKGEVGATEQPLHFYEAELDGTFFNRGSRHIT